MSVFGSHNIVLMSFQFSAKRNFSEEAKSVPDIQVQYLINISEQDNCDSNDADLLPSISLNIFLLGVRLSFLCDYVVVTLNF